MTCAELVNQADVWGFSSRSSCLDKPERSINTLSEAHKLTAAGDVDGVDLLSALPSSASGLLDAREVGLEDVGLRGLLPVNPGVGEGGDSERERSGRCRRRCCVG